MTSHDNNTTSHITLTLSLLKPRRRRRQQYKKLTLRPGFSGLCHVLYILVNLLKATLTAEATKTQEYSFRSLQNSDLNEHISAGFGENLRI